ncbi:M48 family metallopeptidase [Gudongella sp. DL1XJH-153]|uniref:M48 family metallopeptidase n=1 Tax=Gudongella sp. DL1XJH-153 TaxID=3409804 RepID=UPI003BB78F0B
MSRRLVALMILFLILLAVFVVLVIRAENRNMEQLRNEYPELSEDALNLRNDALRLWAIRLPFGFILPLLLLFTGFAQRISVFAGERFGMIMSGIIVGLAIFGVMYLINLPFSFYSSFVLRHKYGLTDQTLLRWLELSLKGFLINDGVLALLIWIPYMIIQWRPDGWWLPMGMLAVPVAIFLIFVSPLIIDPIFNNYSPLPDGQLREDMEVLLERGGIGDAEIYVVDKSRDTNTMNAYMTGIFSGERIVFWDTTLNNLQEEEVLSIAAHEMGHYIKGHIWKGIFAGSAGIFLVLYLINISANWILKSSGGAFGFRNIHNYASIPLLIFLLNLFLFLGNPVTNGVSRRFEKEADLYQISLSQDREAAVTAMTKLYEKSLGLPRPSELYKFWYSTHPPIEERIEFYRTEEFLTFGGEES